MRRVSVPYLSTAQVTIRTELRSCCFLVRMGRQVLIIYSKPLPAWNKKKTNGAAIERAKEEHKKITEQVMEIDGVKRRFYTAANPTAWMNTDLMLAWFSKVVKPYINRSENAHRSTSASRHPAQCSEQSSSMDIDSADQQGTASPCEPSPVMYLDNMSAHTAPAVIEQAKELGD